MDERFFVYLDGQLKFPITSKKNDNLSILRKSISSRIITDFFFTFDNNSIKEEEEQNFLIIDIIVENKIFLISNKKFEPIPGSILKTEIDGTKIYSYPLIELTEIEKWDPSITKNILFIGKSGDGKSTFINALINVLLNVNIKYDARYKLVLEESKNGQHKSQTPEIKIYNVKIKNKPILRLIDTPGFIDTEGKDEIYIEQFRKFFKSEISYLHCICFILNFSSYRYNKIQIELFNKVSSLFAEEIKNNFVFILTHYSFIGNDDSSVALFQNDVFQNIINANNIFKLDSECAFTGDINIRNIIWEKSTKVIENLIL